MIYKLQKWKCPKCELEWWSIYGRVYFKCWECRSFCNWTPNIWKVNEEGGIYG